MTTEGGKRPSDVSSGSTRGSRWLGTKSTSGGRRNTSVAKAKLQNAKRDRKVPDWVIDKQFGKLVAPTESEGFDKVVII